jgi:hypothetical protein
MMPEQRPEDFQSMRETAQNLTPFIGIFWLIMERNGSPVLLADRCSVAAGEPYGDFLTYGGHYDHWSDLAALGAAGLRRRGLPTAPAWSEYEEWPRGRVVHHVPTGRFVVYADRQLQKPITIGMIVRHFKISADGFDVRSDRHYASTRKLRSS